MLIVMGCARAGVRRVERDSKFEIEFDDGETSTCACVAGLAGCVPVAA